ncbi:hypothetical protein C0992_008324, partial [Termitomyces sp. T32_za158]
MQAAIDGATRLALAASKRSKCEPFTTEVIATLCEKLNIEDPLDAAINACLKVAFFGMARLGELVLPSQKAFDPEKHVKRSDVGEGEDRTGNNVT